MAEDYSLYYWPLPFRGHFIRYVLAHAGTRWDEPPIEALAALKNAPVSEQPLPFMAPPLLHDRGADIWVAQMPAILAYLGEKHALYPCDPAKDALTNTLIGNAGDVLEEITCNCGRTMWSQEAWDAFVDVRLPRWMAIFEEIGRRHGLTDDAGTMLGTPQSTLADLAVAALWATMTECLPAIEPLLKTHAPAIAALSNRVAAMPAISAMRAEWRAQHGEAYCGGQIEASIRHVLAGS
ncbi:glutathione S-transferase family protein [Tropicimonas marinistellae]|uniref:glutathione S-transferase family protein n=1 Tax=Tropicimonas marinistellae TaxID=1739787 RepID=UPI0008376DA6|nr:glutathione S-transferase family protein [Tropicimonas marinistellae]